MSHVDSPSPVTHVSLCAGYGGIDLGLHRAVRNLRTIAVSEIEAFACANLVAKMEAGLLDPAPIWTDLKTFPWSDFRDRVDILSGGYPCQPFSAAGKRLGAEDPRHLWPFISAGIAAMRPSVCFFENVEGHISLGLSDVIEDLGRLGYRATWCVASASECGAPHQRKRIFILAHRHGERGQLSDWWREPAEQVPVGYGETRRDDLDNPNAMAAGGIAGLLGDAQGEEQGEGLQRQRSGHAAGYAGQDPWPSRPGEQQFAWEPPRVVANDHSPHAGHGEQRPERTPGDLSGGCGEELDDAARLRSAEPSDEAMGNSTHANRRPRVSAKEAGAGPGDIWRRRSGESSKRTAFASLGRDIDGALSWSRLSELSGLSDQELAEIRHWMVASDNRTDELRLLGNGVVPAVAERAFRLLVGELMEHQP